MIAAAQPWMMLAGLAVLAVGTLCLALRLRYLANELELLRGKDEDRERQLDTLRGQVIKKGAGSPPNSPPPAGAAGRGQHDHSGEGGTRPLPTSFAVGDDRAEAPASSGPDPYEAPDRLVTKTACRHAGEIAAAYNDLVSDFSGGSADAFRDKWDPIVVTATGPRRFAPDESGKLWFVPDEAGADYGALLPGPEVIRLWAKFYRKMSGLDAKTLLGELYEISEGSSLSVGRPATALREGASFRLGDRGELSGI